MENTTNQLRERLLIAKKRAFETTSAEDAIAVENYAKGYMA